MILSTLVTLAAIVMVSAVPLAFSVVVVVLGDAVLSGGAL